MSSLARLAHDALIYTTRREFLAGTLPFLREGLERGHACVVATTPPNTEALRHKLGPAAGDVTFLDRDGWYQRPVTTVGGWKRLLDEAIEQGRPFVRIIGEVGFGPPDKHPSWTRYESALNVVFAEAPAWIICPYDTTALPPGVVADARRTHPDVWAPHRAASVDYVQPEQLLATVPEPMPAAVRPPDLDVEFGAASALREMVRAAAGLLPADRIADLLIVVNELATNSLRHGRGPRRARFWTTPAAVLGEVTDHGPGPADPLAGYRPPDGGAAPGWGLWIAHQLCDRLAVEHRDGVTSVRFAISAQ